MVAELSKDATLVPRASEIDKNQSRLIFSIDSDFSSKINRNLFFSIDFISFKINIFW